MKPSKASMSLLFAFLSPVYASFMLDYLGSTPKTWAIIFSSSACFLMVGSTFYILFCDDKVQEWAKSSAESQKLQETADQ